MTNEQQIDKEANTHSIQQLADLVTAQAKEVELTSQVLREARSAECGASNRDTDARKRLAILTQALAARLDRL